MYKYDILFLFINLFIIVYMYIGCKKCLFGIKKEIVGCGFCWMIFVILDINIFIIIVIIEKLIIVIIEKLFIIFGLFINYNYLVIFVCKVEFIGLFICFWCIFLKML